MQLPSNKVGLVLIGVVLVSSATIFITKYQKPREVKDLQNVNILVGRNTNQFDKAGDADADGLLDWQEEIYKSNPNDPDTDGDGTPDGEEVSLKRDPTVAGPDDPLLTTQDYFDTGTDRGISATGTITQKLSVDLASEYFLLKKNNQLTAEKESELVTNIAQNAINEAKITNRYVVTDLISVASSKATVKTYGEEFARISLQYYTKIDSYKNLSDNVYMERVGGLYVELAQALSNMNVPTVATEVQLRIINGIDQTGLLFKRLGNSSSDPIGTMVAIGNQKQIAQGDLELYTSLSSYFKENGIIFDDAEVIRFWNHFAI